MTANRCAVPAELDVLFLLLRIEKIISPFRWVALPKTVITNGIVRNAGRRSVLFTWRNNARRLERYLERAQQTYRAFLRVYFIRYYLNLLFYWPK
jgi:hypothetical protein